MEHCTSALHPEDNVGDAETDTFLSLWSLALGIPPPLPLPQGALPLHYLPSCKFFPFISEYVLRPPILTTEASLDPMLHCSWQPTSFFPHNGKFLRRHLCPQPTNYTSVFILVTPILDLPIIILPKLFYESF